MHCVSRNTYSLCKNEVMEHRGSCHCCRMCPNCNYYCNYCFNYTFYCRFVKILDLQSQCRPRVAGQEDVDGQSVSSCHGFPTSVVCTKRRTVLQMSALLWEKAPWWSMIESTLLLDAANTVLQWWMMQLACNLQWIPTLNPTFGCGIMRIIETKIGIIVTKFQW